MKIAIEEIDKSQEEEILIRCYGVTDEVLSYIKKLKAQTTELVGYEGDNIHRLDFDEVYYFEAVDNKVFVYYKEKVFECKQKLYEIETLCEGRQFFRASRSYIVNISKIAYIKPSLSGRFAAMMDNDETLMVSRQYVPLLKSKLGL